MLYVNKFIRHVLKNLSLYLFAFLLVFTSDRYSRWMTEKTYGHGIFYDDVEEYYAYLPVLFLPQNSNAIDSAINTNTLKYSKRTIGMAILYSPFFFIADIIAGHGGYDRDGYSAPYQNLIHFGTIFYCLLGLWFCRKSLLLFFNDTTVFISLLCIYLGTNLFFYTYGNGEMAHSYLFFLFSVFIYSTLKWVLKNSSFYLLILSFILGLITLIRPSDIIIILFPLLFKINSIDNFVSRIKFIFAKPILLSIAAFFFLLPLFTQMLIWKSFTGHYIYYSYVNERFFFLDPQLTNILFSFRKGWLIYTPIMIFSLIGLVLSKKHLKEFFIFSIVFFLFNTYLLSCWWDWSYGGSFGCRAIIQSYAFLIFPFAVFVQWCWSLWKEKIIATIFIRTSLTVILFLFIKLNLFQSWQYKFLIINWNGMNKEAYEYVFLKERLSPEEYKIFSAKLTPPNYTKMLEGKRN